MAFLRAVLAPRQANGAAQLNAGVDPIVDALAIEGDVDVNNAHYSDALTPPTIPLLVRFMRPSAAPTAPTLYIGLVAAPVIRGVVILVRQREVNRLRR
ncbi:hypothetical protein AB8B21_02550 [Tardiphaga sp. 866_E4_N2_1]|uniref:hypothetical protein n=1 Tax=unclassified Tardiphaga TaxID=2631404 RepID=UPI003F237625